MVDMPMRNHDPLHLQRMFREQQQDLIDVVPRVNHDRLMRLLIAENRTIALQHPDRQNLVNHVSNILGVCRVIYFQSFICLFALCTVSMYSLGMRTRTPGLTPYRRHVKACDKFGTETFYPSTPAEKKADRCLTAAFSMITHLEKLGRIPKQTAAAKLPGEISVADAVKKWLATKTSRRWGTSHNCEVFAERRLLPWCQREGIVSVKTFDDYDTAERFIKSWKNMRTGKDLEIYSWDSVRTHMSMFIGFCITKTFCTENHFKKYDAFTKAERNLAESKSGSHGLELDEIDRLFTYMAALPTTTVTTEQRTIDNRWLEGMMQLMFWTGMRISDAVKFCDQEFERNLEGDGWQVNFIALKNGKRCIVPVGDDLVKNIRSNKHWLDVQTNKRYY